MRGFKFVSVKQWFKDCPYAFDAVIKEELYGDLLLPRRATTHSAGYDVYAPWKFELNPGESIKLPLGFKAYMEKDEFLAFYPRSSLGFKFFLRLANTIGIGDFDFYDNPGNEGHYFLKLRNEGEIPVVIEKGDAIAQAIFQKYLLIDGDNYENGDKRVGGIGSTNK